MKAAMRPLRLAGLIETHRAGTTLPNLAVRLATGASGAELAGANGAEPGPRPKQRKPAHNALPQAPELRLHGSAG